MIVNLQRMLDGLDPSRGDRLDDPELENMYQKVVELQPQIVSLMKKYADQRGESFFPGLEVVTRTGWRLICRYMT